MKNKYFQQIFSVISSINFGEIKNLMLVKSVIHYINVFFSMFDKF